MTLARLRFEPVSDGQSATVQNPSKLSATVAKKPGSARACASLLFSTKLLRFSLKPRHFSPVFLALCRIGQLSSAATTACACASLPPHSGLG